MIELVGNLWDYFPQEWICVTTNGYVKSNGEAVMGRGCAREAAMRFPALPTILGNSIGRFGNHLAYLRHHILAFPVKHNWWEGADLRLITRSLQELDLAKARLGFERVFLPRPGCGNGGLDWELVRPLCEKHGDWLAVISKPIDYTTTG